MVSKEPNHLPSANSCSNHNPDKTLTVRSVLLNRDSPDIEIRLKRRRNRTQQVRFKDLDDGGQAEGGRRRSTVEQGSPHPNRKSSSYWGQREQAGQLSTGQEVTTNGASVVGAVRGDMAGTIGEVAAILARAPPHPLTPGPLRRAWAQSRPCSLTLPNPRRPCMSTAIQTSPSLQKPLPFSIARNRSHSLGENRENGTVDEVYPQNHIQPAVAAQDGSGPFRSPSNSLPGHPKPDGPQVFLPAPCPLAGNPGPCAAQLYSKPEMLGEEPCSCTSITTVTGSTQQPCTTTPHSRKQPLSQAQSNPGKTVPACPKASALGTSPPKDIIPCALPPHTVHSPQELPVCAVPSKTILPSPLPSQTMLPCISLSKTAGNPQDSRRGGERERRDSPLPPPPPPPPPYTPRREVPPPSQNCLPPYSLTEPLARTGSEREKGGQGLMVPSEGKHAQPLVAVTPDVPQTQAPESSPAGSGQNSPKLRWPQSEQQANNPSKKANNLSIPGKGPPSGPCVSPLVRTKEAPLTPEQAKTLKHVQELLGGLVSGARSKLELAKAKEKLLGPQGPLHDIGSLHSQLQSLEGVLETSQNTIKVLLDVIQDLEKKEAERDGRLSYRTGQDIENCGTCRDCACIIYSVEHDFRLQEGQFTRTWRIAEHPDSDQGSPQTGPPQPPLPCREDSPLPARSSHVAKKGRRKCFWFL